MDWSAPCSTSTAQPPPARCKKSSWKTAASKFRFSSATTSSTATKPCSPSRWAKLPVGTSTLWNKPPASPLPKLLPGAFTGLSLRWWTSPAMPAGAASWKAPVKIPIWAVSLQQPASKVFKALISLPTTPWPPAPNPLQLMVLPSRAAITTPWTSASIRFTISSCRPSKRLPMQARLRL